MGNPGLRVRALLGEPEGKNVKKASWRNLCDYDQRGSVRTGSSPIPHYILNNSSWDLKESLY